LRLRGADEAAGRAAAAAAQRHADAMAELVLRLPRVNTPAGRAAVARAAAEASRGAGNADADCWRAAVEAAEFDVFEQSSSRLRLVEALLDTGERGAEAVAELRAAYDTATALGAAPLRERIVDLARRARLDSELGLPPVLDATPGLTPREVEVLRLVSDGLSNRQIGRALFISEKTASVHVSNILAKLGAASRTEAAAVARRRGLLGSAA
jgi:DNA-binding NarL/FixJ family response regulator